MGMLNATVLRDALKDEGDDPGALAAAFATATAGKVKPRYRATLDLDRGRRAEMGILARGGIARGALRRPTRLLSPFPDPAASQPTVSTVPLPMPMR